MEQNTQSNENNSQIGTNANSGQIFNKPEKKNNKKVVLLAVIVVVVVLGIVASYFLFFSDKKDDNTPVLENEKVEEVKIDKELDSDQDGLPDYIEKVLGTDLNNSDTDGDGYSDFEEIKNGYDPLGNKKYTEEEWEAVKELMRDEGKEIYKEIFEEKEKIKYCIGHCPILEEEIIGIEFVIGEDGMAKDNLYIFNIQTGKKIIINPQPVNILSFSRYEDNVIWVDNRRKESFKDDNWTVWMKNILTNEETELFSTRVEEMALYKNKLIFLKHKEFVTPDTTSALYAGDNKLYMYDLNTKETKILVNEPTETMHDLGMGLRRSCLSVYENIVVYRDDIFGEKENDVNWDGVSILYALDLSTMEKHQIDKVGRISNCPSRNKNVIAYEVGSKKEGTFKIFEYDLIKGQRSEITEVEKPFILDEYRVAWVSYLKLYENELVYSKRSSFWTGPDVSSEYNYCMKVNLNSKKKEDVTCE